MSEMRINEIFYSLQGEGHYAGTPAVFVRFSGCNLKCPFCDTDFHSFREMSIPEILREISVYPARRVILTGGEPTLQLTAPFMNALHEAGYTIHIETNGTNELPAPADWVTCSPKSTAKPNLQSIDELKIVYQGEDDDPSQFLSIPAGEYYLQPCDTGDPDRNRDILEAAIDYVKANPQWRLSLQTHKLTGIR